MQNETIGYLAVNENVQLNRFHKGESSDKYALHLDGPEQQQFIRDVTYQLVTKGLVYIDLAPQDPETGIRECWNCQIDGPNKRATLYLSEVSS